MMRSALLGLAFLSGLALAQATIPDKFSKEQFEKRFRAADKAGVGYLTRDEAYREFPRMPDFFDEIDSNKDSRITLKEVDQALQRRVDAAIQGSTLGSRHIQKDTLGSGAATGSVQTKTTPEFASKAEAKRMQRYEYYETLAGNQYKAQSQGELLPSDPQPRILDRSY